MPHRSHRSLDRVLSVVRALAHVGGIATIAVACAKSPSSSGAATGGADGSASTGTKPQYGPNGCVCENNRYDDFAKGHPICSFYTGEGPGGGTCLAPPLGPLPPPDLASA